MTHNQFELKIGRDANLISLTRRFAEEICEQLLHDPDAVSRIALAAHELCDNAVKYGRDASLRLRIDFQPTAHGVRVCVMVANTPDPAHVGPLVRTIAALDEATDAYLFYVELLRRNTKATPAGLGLARIRAAEMSLRLDRRSEEVCLYAETFVDQGEQP